MSESSTSIDVHAHVVPEGVLDALAADDGRYGIELGTRPDGRRTALIAGRVEAAPLQPDLIEMGPRLASMDAAGVDVQLLSSWIDMTAYALPAEAGERYARMFNEALVATAAAYPGRFRTLATVPLQAPVAAAAELRHAVGTLGMDGAEIATTVDGRDLDDPSWSRSGRRPRSCGAWCSSTRTRRWPAAA